MKLFNIILCITLALAITPNVGVAKYESSVAQLSLPDLLRIDDKSQIKNYQITNDVKFDNGRLLMGKKGELWSKNPISKDEFTIEVDFRSSGQSSDVQFIENNLSIFLTENLQSFDKFDGFKFLVNNNHGLKIFNNDGSKYMNNELDESIADCMFRYLESNVPFTIRISYQKSSNWFKVQIDNNLCFKTDKIQLPNLNKLRLGVTTNINQQSKEEFEILNVKVWDHLIEDSIDDHGLMDDGELKVEYTTVVVEASQPTTKPSYIRESLMEKAQRQKQEQMSEERANDNNVVENLQQLSSYSRLTSERIDQLYKLQDEFNLNLQQTTKDLQALFANQYAEILTSISNLNQKLIGEVREQHFGMEELSKKVDLLMSNHKEIAYQYEKSSNEQKPVIQPPKSSFVDTLIKWILVPLLIILIVLVIFIHRLRHDIKHSKLL